MIYITGDMHGEDARWYDRQLKRLRSGDTLLICGDFGYVWNGSKREKKDLEWLGSRPYAIGFLDGTHENFDLLNAYRQTVWNGGRVHRISGSLFHLIRGQIFTIEGLRFFVFGGGESPDKEIRLEQHSWWREELPSPAEMAEGAENLDEAGLQVDYILTHEPPSMVKSAVLLRSGHTDRVSKLNGYLEEIDRSCAYRHWYFGSIHEDRTITPKHTALFRKIIIAGEDLSNAEDNNFFRNMLGSFRTISRKAPAVKPSLETKQEAKKKAEEAQKQVSVSQKPGAVPNTDPSRTAGVHPTTGADRHTGASANTDAGSRTAAGVGQGAAAGIGQDIVAGVGQGAVAGVGQDIVAGIGQGAGQAGQKPDAAGEAGGNVRLEPDAAQNPITAQDTPPALKPDADQKGPAEQTESILPARQDALSETAAETAGDLLQGPAVLRPAALSRRKEPIPGEGLSFFPAADRPVSELTLDPSPARSADEPAESPAFPADMVAAFRLEPSEPTQPGPTAGPAEEDPPASAPWQPADHDNSTSAPPAGLAGGGDEEERV